MIALHIEDIKNFMNKLFKDIVFDDFEVISIDINQGVNFNIDGTLNHSFYNSLEQELLTNQTHIKWSNIKEIIFSIIRGNKTPSLMKIVFALSKTSRESLLNKLDASHQEDDFYGFYLNIFFTPNQLKVVTGTNYKSFTLDKTTENYYDSSIRKFLLKHNIPYNEDNE